MLAQADAAFEAAAAATAQPRGPVRMACPVAAATSLLSPLLPQFLARHPQVRLEIEADNRRVDVLAEGFDLALRVRTTPSGEDGLVMRRYAELADVLVASPDYLVAAGRPQAPADLAAHPTLSYATTPERQRWSLIAADGAQVEVEHTPRLRCHDFPVLHVAALSGLGVALLPLHIVREALAAGTLERVLPDWQLPQGVFHVVFPHRRGLLPAVRALLDFLAETMPAAVAAVPACPPRVTPPPFE